MVGIGSNPATTRASSRPSPPPAARRHATGSPTGSGCSTSIPTSGRCSPPIPRACSRPRWRRSSGTRVRSCTCAATSRDDTELAGQPLVDGDRVVIWYRSANHDEIAFERARALRRHPEPQRPPRVRRGRSALLPRRPPRPHGDPHRAAGAVPTVPRPRRDRRSPSASRCVRSTASSTCRWRRTAVDALRRTSVVTRSHRVRPWPKRRSPATHSRHAAAKAVPRARSSAARRARTTRASGKLPRPSRTTTGRRTGASSTPTSTSVRFVDERRLVELGRARVRLRSTRARSAIATVMSMIISTTRSRRTAARRAPAGAPRAAPRISMQVRARCPASGSRQVLNCADSCATMRR